MSKEKELQIRNSTAEFLIFTRQVGEDSIEVRVADETVWLTQKLISVLFDKGRSTITEHLKNIFDTGELDEKSVCRDFRHTAEESEFEKYRIVQERLFESDFDRHIKKTLGGSKKRS